MSDSNAGREAPAERVPRASSPDRPVPAAPNGLPEDSASPTAVGPANMLARRRAAGPGSATPVPHPRPQRTTRLVGAVVGSPGAAGRRGGNGAREPGAGAPGNRRPAAPGAATEDGPTTGAGGSGRRRRGGRGRRRGGAADRVDGQPAEERLGNPPADGRRRTSPSGTNSSARRPEDGRAGGARAGGGRRGPGAPTAEPARTVGTGAFGAAGGTGAAPADGPVEEKGAAGRPHGRETRTRPLGRYLMCVHVEPERTQIAVLEGRALVEHYVARPQDEAQQIIGNIYRGRVKNVLPGMEAAFVDIGTPKNAVLYWGDVAFDRDDIERQPGADRIEHLLRPGQTIICQVTKNPIGLKGARLTQEVSLAGRFVVLVPESGTYGISRRLDDNERRRLRKILDEVRPEGHGLIVRTAAAGASADDLRRDVRQLVAKWAEIDERARRLPAPALLYSEPHMAVRIIREELTEEHRAVLVDDPELFEIVKSYVAAFDPTLAERIELYDATEEPLPLFERHHVHEQLHKAIDRKVWLPSGGSLIVERTEALTVIDVNTGKNVGSSSLEETVFENNLEAADEIARQLRLRDIGGIIVIDFVDMEIRANRQAVMGAFRAALSRDKTPTQVFDISDLGLVEMTRKRVGEGLVESLSETCPMCNGRGIIFEDQ